MSADKINPYQPPKSDTGPALGAEAVVKRPIAVKWVLTIQILTLIVIPLGYFNAFQKHGAIVFTVAPWATAGDAAQLLACFPLLLGVRRPWVYWVTVLFLALHLKGAATTLLGANPAFPYYDKATVAIAYVMGGFLGFLFYRFTFGHPSRHYFRG
jgi:hypothetical protein